MASGEKPKDRGPLFRVVRSYIDPMIEHGRDRYGQKDAPLFAEALDRKKLQLLSGAALEKARSLKMDDWGIRSHDRMLGGANPQHVLNAYQVMYALRQITGNETYAEEADRSLAYFLTNCQSPATGLFYWGEHAGWDLRRDAPLQKRAGKIHEFFRPWILWERSWKLAPDASRRFAIGLWKHQISNHQNGNFSRHAKIPEHGPGTGAPYARHGGFYIETWAHAYEKTGRKQFLRAIRTVLNGLERARKTNGGYVIGGHCPDCSRRSYDLSLAISLENAAPKLPETDMRKLKKVAAINDRVFKENYRFGDPPSAEELWSSEYGGRPPANDANHYMLRYEQVEKPVYRKALLHVARQYLRQDINKKSPIHPGTMGNVILMMVNAYRLTEDQRYLKAAGTFADRGLELFFDSGNRGEQLLPKATHRHQHYEAVTRADTFMMALLKLWVVKNAPDLSVRLTFTDR